MATTSTAQPSNTGGEYDLFTALLTTADTLSFAVVSGHQQSDAAACWAWFSDAVDKVGWAELHFKSNSTMSDDVQVMACGFLEGFVSQHRIWQSITNVHVSAQTASPVLLKWLHINEEYNLAQHDKDPQNLFWAHVRYNILQYKAMAKGYAAAAPAAEQLTEEDFLLLQADEETDDIQKSLNRVWETAPYSRMSGPEVLQDMLVNEHCSALIKPTADLSDILISHNTWGRLTRMLRVMKSYHLYLTGSASSGVMFPGYFGVLMCGDDIYVTDETKLAVVETSNSILNQTMWSLLTPQSVLYWQRALVANRLAHNAKEWIELFGKEQSGTYNNQWMVLDMKLFFSAGGVIQPNTLWVSEGAPGLYHAEDMSSMLVNGWWPSFNRPYFQEVYQKTGFVEVAAKWGDLFSYQRNPRSKIFRRDAGRINDVTDMEQFITTCSMTDPFTYGFPGNSIGGRFDFMGGPVTGSPYDGWFKLGLHGARDAKVISALANMKGGGMSMFAVNGPPHTGNECPVFQWSTSQWANASHVGHPDRFDFPWVSFQSPQ